MNGRPKICDPLYDADAVTSRFVAPTNDAEAPSVAKAITATKTTVMVDYRDVTGPTPFQFTVDLAAFGANVRNADKIDLKALAFPHIADQPWVALEVRQVTNGAVLHTSGYTPFATVFFSQAGPVGQVEVIKGHDHLRNTGGISPPVRELTRIDCRFTKYGGQLLTPDDTGGVTSFQFVLEITGKVVGVSQALQSAVIAERPHASELAIDP